MTVYHPFIHGTASTRSNVQAASLFVALREHIIGTYDLVESIVIIHDGADRKVALKIRGLVEPFLSGSFRTQDDLGDLLNQPTLSTPGE